MNRAFLGLFLLIASIGLAQTKRVYSDAEKPIYERMRSLRSVPDDKRGQVTRELASAIRNLPASDNKLNLATGLASLSTEGDFGHETLEAVAATLAVSLKEHALPDQKGAPAYPYVELAQLVRYEHVSVTLDDPHYSVAMQKLEAEDVRRQAADFTLKDLQGHEWNLKSLKGKVVLVNFWASWCPPCRKELPDLDSLYRHFKKQGLIVLAISDEDASNVRPFVQQSGFSYPVLLDGGKIHEVFGVEGIPKSFVYDRDGKLVAQAIDMRTKRQFEDMLARADLR